MRKFFFDDVRNPPDSSWTVARDVAEAKRVLGTEQFDIMSLDHDIGYEMMCDICYSELKLTTMPGAEAGTLAAFATGASVESKLERGCPHMQDGTDLANWMVENLKVWPAHIFIHSANPYASNRMKTILAGKAATQVMSYTDVRKVMFRS